MPKMNLMFMYAILPCSGQYSGGNNEIYIDICQWYASWSCTSVAVWRLLKPLASGKLQVVYKYPSISEFLEVLEQRWRKHAFSKVQESVPENRKSTNDFIRELERWSIISCGCCDIDCRQKNGPVSLIEQWTKKVIKYDLILYSGGQFIWRFPRNQ